jgi:predicted transcriptional regulator
MKWLLIPVLAACAAMPVFAQRDFLTNDEIEKVREVQEPNLRIKLYILFARQRMDQFQQLLKKDKKGRSLEVRELLEDYSNILDAMGNVSDDALKRHVPITEGLDAASSAEKRFLAQLRKVDEDRPADADQYEVELKEALAATEDGLELAEGDTGTRAAELAAREKKEKQESTAILKAEGVKPTDVAGVQGDKTPDGKPKRKPPTLMRPGEKPPDSN